LADADARVERAPSLEPGYRRRNRRRRRTAYALIAFLALLLWLAATAPASKTLQPDSIRSITLLDKSGEPIARRGAIIEEPVEIDRLPDHVWKAFLAIEDRRFFYHPGIDPVGIARAMVRNVTAFQMREGASTITQQLAKQTFLSADREIGRKLHEMLLAFWLEVQLSKDEILRRYLSTAYFGDNVYGLRAAARHYFDKEPERLTVAGSAMLAGLVKAPSRLAPTNDLKAARERADVVLGAMVDAGVVEEAEAESLAPATPRPSGEKVPAGTYFSDWLFASMPKEGGHRQIKTTLDSRLQRLAVEAVGKRPRSAQVALVAMQPGGHVVAMVGGRSYEGSKYNRVTQAQRQPGSTFKLFVYLAALKSGMTPDDYVLDAPVTIGGWTPQNSGGRYLGPITLRQAFAISSNVAAVRLSEKVGRDRVIDTAKQLGIKSKLEDTPSLALGSSTTTLLEMTSAYAGVAWNRFPVTPRGVPDSDQSWLKKITGGQSSLDVKGELPMMHSLLWSVLNIGTGREAALPIPAFGKTGTTQDNRDAFFIGFAGNLVTGVWIGRDDNDPLEGNTGGAVPAQIWREFMSAALFGDSPPPPPRPTILRLDSRGEVTEVREAPQRRGKGSGRGKGRGKAKKR
jgi:penicillin-binding protein 1A